MKREVLAIPDFWVSPVAGQHCSSVACHSQLFQGHHLFPVYRFLLGSSLSPEDTLLVLVPLFETESRYGATEPRSPGAPAVPQVTVWS